MTNMNDNPGDPWNLESAAAARRAEAVRKRACADRNLKDKLEQLKKLIQSYEKGSKVCPEIKELMQTYPSLKECYPEYWTLCAL